jgi:peptide/nickel transport system permease protein
MLRYLLRRLLLALLVCATVLVASFTLTRLAVDPAVAIAGPTATEQDIITIRKSYGFDRPLTAQFFSWLRDAAHGDFGQSYFYHAPVSELIAARLPITLRLGLVGIVFAILIAIPLGVLAALREGSALDKALMLVALIGQALPSFWLALLLMIWIGLDLGWLPISGIDQWTGYILPGIVLAFTGIPALMRLTRSGMIDALASDYIRTARAKGLSCASIVLKHALRNAAMPVVSVAAVQLGFMLGGSIVAETIFAVHGLGYLAWESISKNDIPVVQVIVLLLAAMYIVLTLLADMMNALLDPRLRSR